MSEFASTSEWLDAIKPSLKIRTENLYVVETQPFHENLGGLHSLTSKHLVTATPGPGDKIAAVIRCRIGKAAAGWTIAIARENKRFAIVHDEEALTPAGRWVNQSFFPMLTSHPGRAPLLGEDGLEDAFGQLVLEELAFEKFALEKEWSYAPCAYSEIVEGMPAYWPQWDLEGHRATVSLRLRIEVDGGSTCVAEEDAGQAGELFVDAYGVHHLRLPNGDFARPSWEFVLESPKVGGDRD
jgi:hypothetical protein